MKKLLSLLICFTVASILRAQTDKVIAATIADKMKDTLSLSTTQRDSIYRINLLLLHKKIITKQSPADSLRIRPAWVERERDAFYRKVLTADQYSLYVQKKASLVGTSSETIVQSNN